MDRKIPNKLFFKIGEVCEITDTQPYVLRYWESEFPSLAPAKNSSGQRIYRRRDIETVLRIKQLLYDEGFTIAGAKKRLESEMAGRADTPSSAAAAAAANTPNPPTDTQPVAGNGQEETTPQVVRDEAARTALKQVREGLRDILTLLDRNDKNRV
jgi:DNA-binding transcriptional MerR regulator